MLLTKATQMRTHKFTKSSVHSWRRVSGTSCGTSLEMKRSNLSTSNSQRRYRLLRFSILRQLRCCTKWLILVCLWQRCNLARKWWCSKRPNTPTTHNRVRPLANSSFGSCTGSTAINGRNTPTCKMRVWALKELSSQEKSRDLM